jgi:hypothetical protein
VRLDCGSGLVGDDGHLGGVSLSGGDDVRRIVRQGSCGLLCWSDVELGLLSGPRRSVRSRQCRFRRRRDR